MSDKLSPEEEKKITQMIADTFGFEVKRRGVVCRICGVRFQEYTTGKHMNDRMIQHAENRHYIGYEK